MLKRWVCVITLVLCPTLSYAFDTALFTHCLRWTPQSTGETFYALAVQDGATIGLPHIATLPRAADAYHKGVMTYWQLQLHDALSITERCAYWITHGIE